MNKRRLRRVCPKKAQICLLSPGKSQISASYATINGSPPLLQYHCSPPSHTDTPYYRGKITEGMICFSTSLLIISAVSTSMFVSRIRASTIFCRFHLVISSPDVFTNRVISVVSSFAIYNYLEPVISVPAFAGTLRNLISWRMVYNILPQISNPNPRLSSLDF